MRRPVELEAGRADLMDNVLASLGLLAARLVRVEHAILHPPKAVPKEATKGVSRWASVNKALKRNPTAAVAAAAAVAEVDTLKLGEHEARISLRLPPSTSPVIFPLVIFPRRAYALRIRGGSAPPAARRQ